MISLHCINLHFYIPLWGLRPGLPYGGWAQNPQLLGGLELIRYMPPCGGGFNTCFFGGFLAINHQPIRGYIRVKGWGLSQYSWGFSCFLEISPRKIGEMESNLTVVGGKKPSPVRPEILRFWTRVRLRTCIASMDLKLETFQLKPHIFMRT